MLTLALDQNAAIAVRDELMRLSVILLKRFPDAGRQLGGDDVRMNI